MRIGCRAVVGVLVVSLITTCSADRGTVLEIQGAVPASGPPCVFAAGATTTVSIATYDPTGGEEFVLGLVVKNKAGESDSDSATTGTQEFKPKANTVTVQSVEACFFDGRDATALAAKDCEAVSEGQRRTLPVSGTIAPDDGVSAIAINLMGLTEMQQLFSIDFDPVNIPIVGAYIEDSNFDGDTDDGEDKVLFSYAAEDRTPTDICEELDPGDDETPCRHAAWGTYPSAGTVRVIWRLRVHGKFQSGAGIQTDWFTYPIEFCPHCLNSACGVLEGAFCSGGCGGEDCPIDAADVEASEALRRCRLDPDEVCQEQCAEPPVACFPFGFQGKRPDLSGTCLPYQMQTTLTCASFDECPALPE